VIKVILSIIFGLSVVIFVYDSSSQILWPACILMFGAFVSLIILCFGYTAGKYHLYGDLMKNIEKEESYYHDYKGMLIYLIKTYQVKIEGNTKITINVSPNTKVAYWSAKSTEKQLPTVEEAYDDYSNSGVVMSDSNGKATIVFNKGSGYIVPNGRFIDKHVHYRELSDEWGMMGPVQTVYL
jgi:hypothetical protein